MKLKAILSVIALFALTAQAETKAPAEAPADTITVDHVDVSNPPKEVVEKCAKENQGRCYVLTQAEFLHVLSWANRIGQLQERQRIRSRGQVRDTRYVQ